MWEKDIKMAARNYARMTTTNDLIRSDRIARIPKRSSPKSINYFGSNELNERTRQKIMENARWQKIREKISSQKVHKNTSSFVENVFSPEKRKRRIFGRKNLWRRSCVCSFCYADFETVALVRRKFARNESSWANFLCATEGIISMIDSALNWEREKSPLM